MIRVNKARGNEQMFMADIRQRRFKRRLVARFPSHAIDYSQAGTGCGVGWLAASEGWKTRVEGVGGWDESSPRCSSTLRIKIYEVASGNKSFGLGCPLPVRCRLRRVAFCNISQAIARFVYAIRTRDVEPLLTWDSHIAIYWRGGGGVYRRIVCIRFFTSTLSRSHYA